MQNKAKVVATIFLICITGAQILTFFDKRQSLKACIHETEGIFVDFIVR